MSDWGTPAPDLTMVKNAARAMENDGLDVHTMTVMLDNGEWRVTIEATDEDLQDVSREFRMDVRGWAIEEIAKQ